MEDQIYNSFSVASICVIQILQDAKTLSLRMNHRGACAGDNGTGDGAGVLTAIPHSLYSAILRYVQVYFYTSFVFYCLFCIFGRDSLCFNFKFKYCAD